MTKTVRREVSMPQSLAEVWDAITDSERLADWMYPNDFQPRIGHQFTFEVPPNPKVNFDGLTVQCEVLECEPPRKLVFSWTAGGIEDTRVTFQLEPQGDGTKLLLEHSGFDVSIPWGEQAFSGAEYGWARMLKQLTKLLAGVTNDPA